MPYATLHKRVTSPLDWMIVLGMLGYTTLQLITDTYPGAINAFTSDGYRIVWGALMVLGFGSAAWGMILKNHIKGLSFEAFGMYVAGFGTLIYSGALLALGVSTAYLSAAAFGVIGLGCIAQGLYIHWSLRRIAAGKFRVNSSDYTPTVLPELKDE